MATLTKKVSGTSSRKVREKKRTDLALPKPPGSNPIPRAPASALRGPWVRAHSAGLGAWYFAPVPGTDPINPSVADRKAGLGGRFDLPHPEGTCYLATTADAAIRERLGHVAAGRPLTAAMISTTSVSEVTPSPAQKRNVANATDPAAVTSITAEISSTGRYRRTQQWAHHWQAVEERTGVLYMPRFSTDPDARSFAVFGPAGPDLTGTRKPPQPASEVLGLTGVKAVSRADADVDDS